MLSVSFKSATFIETDKVYSVSKNGYFVFTFITVNEGQSDIDNKKTVIVTLK